MEQGAARFYTVSLKRRVQRLLCKRFKKERG